VALQNPPGSCGLGKAMPLAMLLLPKPAQLPAAEQPAEGPAAPAGPREDARNALKHNPSP